MANVNIKFNNKDYLLSCDDGQEESLKRLTKFLDKKYSELKDKFGNIGENKLLLITTIQLIDEYFDLKQKVTNQKKKLDEISNKFKEIRSLAIKYKEGKDIEIKNLNQELDNFKKKIEENNSLYESMLDKTTQSLEKIISNKISSKNTHGSGCTFSSALAVNLAKGFTLKKSVKLSKDFTKQCIINAPRFNLKYGPIGHRL